MVVMFLVLAPNDRGLLLPQREQVVLVFDKCQPGNSCPTDVCQAGKLNKITIDEDRNKS